MTTKIKSMEIKLPHDFDDVSVLQEYFNVSTSLARQMIEHDGWLRVDEKRAMWIASDPRMQGCALREPGNVYDISWFAQGPAMTETA